jgi:hypothetical protein
MAEKRVMLKKDGGAPEVEITIVTPHFGQYRLLLWDSASQHAREVAKGDNTDHTTDKHVVGDDASALDRHVLQWDIMLGAMDDASTDRYEVRIQITQDGQPVEGGESVHTGRFVGDETLMGSSRLLGSARFIVES